MTTRSEAAAGSCSVTSLSDVVTSRDAYCTPETASLVRCTATRRLDYSCAYLDTATPLQLFQISSANTATQTGSTHLRDSQRSDDLQPVTLTKVTCSLASGTTTIRFSDEQIDCICEVLRRSNDVEQLHCFLGQLTQDELLRDSESIYKARAVMAYHVGDYKQLFELLESRTYSVESHSDLQSLWFLGHYAVAQELRKSTPLRAVDRYRVRRRHPPPATIWDGEQTVYCLKAGSRQALKQLYNCTKYPSPTAKRHLAAQTGLTMTQITNWFKNRRQREKSPDPRHTDSTTRRRSTTPQSSLTATPPSCIHVSAWTTDYKHLCMALDDYQQCA